MATQVALAHPPTVALAVGSFFNDPVRSHALGLDRTATWGEVACRRQLDGRAITEGEDGLNRALPKGLGPQYLRPLVILQRTGNNLAGGGGASVHQHNHWHGLDPGRQLAQNIFATATQIVGWIGQILALSILRTPVG